MRRSIIACLLVLLAAQPAAAQSLDALKGAIPGAKDAAGGGGSALGGLAGGGIPSLSGWRRHFIASPLSSRTQ